MTKLIINADDFGYSAGVNYGIIEAYKHGIVTSATFMANMPGAAHAAALAKENPGLGIGLHFVLTCGRPMAKNVPSLHQDSGKFHRNIEGADPSDIEKELEAQLTAFYKWGLEPTHLDSHHHVHGHEKAAEIVARKAEELGLPLRKTGRLEEKRCQTVQHFIPDFYGEDLATEDLCRLLEEAAAYETAEIMCHPAFLDEFLSENSSYALERLREVSVLTDRSIRAKAEEEEIELIHYGQIFA